MIKLLSLDTSSTCTGYTKFTFKDSTYNHLLTSSIKTTSKNIYQRFDNIHNHFLNEDLYTWCDLVVFENYAFRGNRVSQLAELNGLLKYNFYLNEKDIEVIAPPTIKKVITGNGRANKDEVRKSIKSNKEFSKIKFKNDDESDSFAVGYSYILKQIEGN